ncbi:hypothetical protein, partial [Streptomyces sp. NPDC000931]|uniref:hypothetical protein n=1 Tax=Streptomyces sp. NPDC000931 TaxID=3154372 RepID=UPI003328ED39
MSLFDSTVLVALITGVITAVSTLGATALSGNRAAQVERWRAEHALERERELRDHERGLAREREVRTRLEEVRGSVLRLDIGMRSIAQIRLHGPSRQGGDDLSELVRQARTDVFEAVIAVERMRDVLSPDGQDRVDDLRDAVDEALNHVQARTDRSAEQVHRDLASGLRALAEVVPAEWVLEAVAAPVVRSG